MPCAILRLARSMLRHQQFVLLLVCPCVDSIVALLSFSAWRLVFVLIASTIMF